MFYRYKEWTLDISLSIDPDALSVFCAQFQRIRVNTLPFEYLFIHGMSFCTWPLQQIMCNRVGLHIILRLILSAAFINTILWFVKILLICCFFVSPDSLKYWMRGHCFIFKYFSKEIEENDEKLTETYYWLKAFIWAM